MIIKRLAPILVGLIALLGLLISSGAGGVPGQADAPGQAGSFTIRTSAPSGGVVELAPAAVARAGAAALLTGEGPWRLAELGYPGFSLADRADMQAVFIEYDLPEDTYQGLDGWYLFQGLFQVEFSGTPGTGQARIIAYANGAALPTIDIDYSYDGESGADISWQAPSLVEGEVVFIPEGTDGLSAEINLSAYLPHANYKTNGVQPGRNTLAFLLKKQSGVRSIKQLSISADSSIEKTAAPPAWYPRLLARIAETPRLAEAAASAVVQAALADARVQELIGGRSYVIDLVTNWDVPQSPQKEVRVDITFGRPFLIEYDWPWPPEPVREKPTRPQKRWVETLTVIVNDEGKVTGISPARQTFVLHRDSTDGAGVGIPRLTEEQKAVALDLALKDATVQELLRDAVYEVGPGGRFGPWYTEKDHTLIGAVLEIWFDTPRTVEADWTSIIDYDEARYQFPHYRQGTYHEAVVAQGLRISVDLSGGMIASLTPKPAYEGA